MKEVYQIWYDDAYTNKSYGYFATKALAERVLRTLKSSTYCHVRTHVVSREEDVQRMEVFSVALQLNKEDKKRLIDELQNSLDN